MLQPDKRAIAEISLVNIEHNIREIKKLVGTKVKFMAVVKADAYGHGALMAVKAIEKNVDQLSVASLGEAIELKKAGVKKPVLILSEVTPEAAYLVVKNGFVQTVYTHRLAQTLSREAKKQKKTAKIHFKVDTGMGRIGASVREASNIYNRILSLPNIQVDGIFTHLAKAEEQNGFTGVQIKKFRDFLSTIETKGIILHCANSAGAIYHRSAHMDMVRVGLSMYGLYPPGGEKDIIQLKPALQFKTRVMYIKRVSKGTAISYGSTYVTDKETNIATLPVGYADGLPRLLSNKGQVLINGKRYPIVGRICMDMTMVDMGSDEGKVGDEAVLIGSQGKGSISADEVASLAGTISYEIICGIGKRVQRIYK